MTTMHELIHTPVDLEFVDYKDIADSMLDAHNYGDAGVQIADDKMCDAKRIALDIADSCDEKDAFQKMVKEMMHSSSQFVFELLECFRDGDSIMTVAGYDADMYLDSDDCRFEALRRISANVINMQMEVMAIDINQELEADADHREYVNMVRSII